LPNILEFENPENPTFFYVLTTPMNPQRFKLGRFSPLFHRKTVRGMSQQAGGEEKTSQK